MAIDYTDLFTLIGKAIKACNYYQSTFATMKSNNESLFQEIADQNLDYLGDGLANAASSHISGLSAGCSFYVNKVSEILLDPTLVTTHLAIVNPTLQNVLPALYKDMNLNDQFVLESLTTVGTPSFTGIGTGSLHTELFLDDISSPVSNPAASNMKYFTNLGANNNTTQLGIVDTVYCLCSSADSEGTEQFTLFGNNAVAPFSEYTESLGGSISIQTTDELNLLTNAGFETYSGGFTGWTIVDAGGTLSQETSLMYRGASAAKIVTLANADTVTFTQELATSLTRGRGYIAGIRFKSISAEAANNLAGTISLRDADNNQIVGADVANVSISTTNWQIAKALLVVPVTIDPDEVLSLQFSLSPTADGVDGIVFDDAFLVPATYFNGIAFALQNGATRFRTGDIFSAAVTRSSPGVFQEFFRKAYGVQLASEGSGDETLPDSLAT